MSQQNTDEIIAETEAVTAQPVEAPRVPSLDLQDLALALNLLSVAIKRGTYEPKELRGVATVYEKLEAFLQYQAQMQAASVAQQKGLT